MDPSNLVDRVRELWDVPGVRAGLIIVGAVIAAKLLELVLRKTLVALAQQTETKLDDVVIDALRRPIFLTAVLVGVGWASAELPFSPSERAVVFSLGETIMVVSWAAAAFRAGHAVLEAISRRASVTSVVQPSTMPVFEMLVKFSVVGAALYFMFLAWEIDLTAWLASAGIIGIAVGFAAKDTLANLFSGIFIIADAPYKVGDFIVLEDNLRGQVIRIGMRSTRVLTTDDIEITVPNAAIGASKIINESGGRSVRSRIRVEVSVAYGTDLDHAREVVRRCGLGVPHVAAEPAPDVLLASFGASGLNLQLQVWLESSAEKSRVIDALNSNIYKALAAAGIEIPYTKADLYVKELPGARSAGAAPAPAAAAPVAPPTAPAAPLS